MERTLRTHLHVIAWPDPVIDRIGFAPLSVYTELAWTPILGLGVGTGAHSTIARTLRRLAAFRLAMFTDDATYAVRRRIPPLTAHHASRLSPTLARAVRGYEQRQRSGTAATAATTA